MTTTADSPLTSYEKLFVGGEWVTPASQDTIEVISPVTEEVIATVPAASEGDVDAAVAAAREAFDHGPWPRLSPAERAHALRRIGHPGGFGGVLVLRRRGLV
jgi:aldehyde dehydrogenase (NAD+)